MTIGKKTTLISVLHDSIILSIFPREMSVYCICASWLLQVKNCCEKQNLYNYVLYWDTPTIISNAHFVAWEPKLGFYCMFLGMFQVFTACFWECFRFLPHVSGNVRNTVKIICAWYDVQRSPAFDSKGKYTITLFKTYSSFANYFD